MRKLHCFAGVSGATQQGNGRRGERGFTVPKVDKAHCTGLQWCAVAIVCRLSEFSFSVRRYRIRSIGKVLLERRDIGLLAMRWTIDKFSNNVR